MPGRGDNNKSGSAGRGASNQSNQPFIADGEGQQKSNHNRRQTGGSRSQPDSSKMDQTSNRNRSTSPGKR